MLHQKEDEIYKCFTEKKETYNAEFVMVEQVYQKPRQTAKRISVNTTRSFPFIYQSFILF